MVCTIYLLKNRVNEKVYVGQTWTSLEKRMGTNGARYKNSIYLYAAIQKHGAGSFYYEKLEECHTQDAANEAEVKHISAFNSIDSKKGYNIKQGGSYGKHSESSKIKISNSLKDKVWSPTALKNKLKFTTYWKGKKRGELNQGQIDKRLQNLNNWVEVNGQPFAGKTHTEKVKLDISQNSKKMWADGKCDINQIRNLGIANRTPVKRELEIIDLYSQDMSVKNICESMKVGAPTIYRILQRNGIELRGCSNNNKGIPRSKEVKMKISNSLKRKNELSAK